jgi:MSHA biogenesis protein MshP
VSASARRLSDVESRIRQRGFSLVAAIFLIVVLAVLAAFAVQVAMGQYQNGDLALAEVRAQAAADAGFEYAANRALRGGGCGAVGSTLPLGSLDLSGYVVTLTCAPAPGSGVNTIIPLGNPPAKPYNVYLLSATATYGTYGQFGYVSRTTARTATDAPL